MQESFLIRGIIRDFILFILNILIEYELDQENNNNVIKCLIILWKFAIVLNSTIECSWKSNLNCSHDHNYKLGEYILTKLFIVYFIGLVIRSLFIINQWQYIIANSSDYHINNKCKHCKLENH